MNWLKKIYLKFKLKIWNLMKKLSCIESLKKAFPDGLSESEKVTSETLCRVGFPYFEIVEIILCNRQITSLINFLKKAFPELSDDEVEELVDTVRPEIKKGKTAKQVLKIIKETMKSVKAKF